MVVEVDGPLTENLSLATTSPTFSLAPRGEPEVFGPVAWLQPMVNSRPATRQPAIPFFMNLTFLKNPATRQPYTRVRPPNAASPICNGRRINVTGHDCKWKSNPHAERLRSNG